jgi:aquaporin Z
MDMKRRLGAEIFGTFWLVLGGCGSAVLAGAVIGAHGVALAFGLSVLTMAYAVGGISGGHFNPAVTLGLVLGGRFDKKDAPAYMAAQVVGAIAAAVVLAVIASGVSGFEFGDGPANAPGFASNGFGDRSPGGYSFLAVVVAEVVMTAFFLIIILGATAKKSIAEFGGLVIGFALTLIHLITIPVSNTSVNPARSISQAIFARGDYLVQLPVFILAPLAGAALGAVAWKLVLAFVEARFFLLAGLTALRGLRPEPDALPPPAVLGPLPAPLPERASSSRSARSASALARASAPNRRLTRARVSSKTSARAALRRLFLLARARARSVPTWAPASRR